MTQRVSIEVADHVAVVTLNRPDKHNALDGAMFEGIVEAAGQVAQMPEVRAVVLHGAGPSFCSGLDVERLRRRSTRPRSPAGPARPTSPSARAPTGSTLPRPGDRRGPRQLLRRRAADRARRRHPHRNAGRDACR